MESTSAISSEEAILSCLKSATYMGHIISSLMLLPSEETPIIMDDIISILKDSGILQTHISSWRSLRIPHKNFILEKLMTIPQGSADFDKVHAIVVNRFQSNIGTGVELRRSDILCEPPALRDESTGQRKQRTHYTTQEKEFVVMQWQRLNRNLAAAVKLVRGMEKFERVF
mmetsp:Transcript_301/g.548  ORF Transcript_301/g.548 Transcript_301/m.548 type:complete len:171 (+) Transcript_301:26-538(+)